MEDKLLRLYDLASHETIDVKCICGRTVHYANGLLQRRHKLPSDTLLIDLQYRFRCKHCNRRRGFQIGIFDERLRSVPGAQNKVRVIVPGEKF
jgi:hypothetical protein